MASIMCAKSLEMAGLYHMARPEKAPYKRSWRDFSG